MMTPIYGLWRGLGILVFCASLVSPVALAQQRRGETPSRPVGAAETLEDLRREYEASVQRQINEAQFYYRVAQMELPQELDARAQNLMNIVVNALVWDGHHWAVPRYYASQIDCVRTLNGLIGRIRYFLSQVPESACHGGYLSQTARSAIRYSEAEQRLRDQVMHRESERNQIRADVERIEQNEEARPWLYRALEDAENQLSAARAALERASAELEVERRLVTCVARYPSGIRIERCRTARLGDLLPNRR
jgi:hypothetical protein